MDTEKEKTIIKKIKKKTKLIRQDNKHVNEILYLLKNTQSKNVSIVCASCQALVDVFSAFVSSQSHRDLDKIAAADTETSEEDQFSSWLREQFKTSCDYMLDLLCHESINIQTAALKSLVDLLRVMGLDSQCMFVDKLIENIVVQVLGEECDLAGQTELSSLLSAWADSQHISCVCLQQMKKILREQQRISEEKQFFNCWRLIKQICKQDINDKSRRLLTGVVCEFLKKQIPTKLYKEILTSISVVMEKMSSPLLLADFLTESFNVGGAISLMSLHGLFLLMHKYNLDYQDFYAKLFSLFEPQIFSAKYRARFFHLADTFLSSTHLPAYLVAAFAKRLARLSLHAPVTGARIAVQFILNLISRHPACEILLHRTEGSEELDSDPFLPDEMNPAKCKALESCLWELQALECHYDPSLSLTAKKRQIFEKDLSDLLELSSADIIALEAKKIKKDTPVNFQRPRGLELYGKFVL